MNHWIFLANNKNPFFVNAKEAYQTRMGHALWGYGPNTPNRCQLRDGDQIVFYLTSPAMAFVGTATISSTALNTSEQNKIQTERVFSGAESGVRLTDIDEWSDAVEIKPLLEDLSFIKNPKRWGDYLRVGGIVRISENDFELITLKPR